MSRMLFWLPVVMMVVGLTALSSTPARAVGLFQCVDGAGRQVCIIDSGNRTDFTPSALCNASCPACGGRCDGARYYPPTAGHWEKRWQVAPGMDNNTMRPSGDMQQDARTILNEGLVAPATPQTVTPNQSGS